MAVVSCPKCSAGLKIPDGSAAAVRCPRCTTVFQPRAKPAADFEVVDESPPAPAPKKGFSLDAAVRSADKPDRRDDDDRPRGRSRRDYEEDDYDDDRPRKAGKYAVARPGVLLIHISLGLYLGGMALHALLVLVAWMGADIPYGLFAFAGILGLGGWLTGLVGFGLTIGGPARSRGLAIACAAVSFVHLVLAFVVSYNDRAAEFGGSTIRWSALVTDLPMLDALIAGLVYQPKGFGDRLLPLFAGSAELARLILTGLLLGSLARAAKAHSAEGQAKFGWIAAPSAVGIAMLVLLLSAVMVESTTKSALRVDIPPPQFGGGGASFQQEMQRRQEEFRQREERIRSMGRTIRVWLHGGELVVYTLHMGTLVLPLMASFGVWNAMGRRR